jgi:hypothetical protein
MCWANPVNFRFGPKRPSTPTAGRAGEGGRAHPEAAEGQAVPLEELAVLVRRVLQQHQDLALGGDAKALGELVLEDVERGVPGHLRKHVPPMRGAVRADG